MEVVAEVCLSDLFNDLLRVADREEGELKLTDLLVDVLAVVDKVAVGCTFRVPAFGD